MLLCSFCITPPANASSSRQSDAYHSYLNGLLLDGVGDYGQAAEAYQKALKYDSVSADIHFRLALDYVRLNDARKAEREFQQVLKLRPRYERARYLLALLYSYEGKLEFAVREYQELLKHPLLELRTAYIRTALARLYVMAGELENAEGVYKTIIENNPDDFDAHFYLGYIYNEFSFFDLAISEFKKALELNPHYPLALNSLSYLYAEQNRELDTALNLIKKALKYEPSNAAFLDTLGWVYFKKGDLENAQRYLENAAVLLEDAEVFDHLGDLYFEFKEYDEAGEYWKKSLKLKPHQKAIQEKLKDLRRIDDSK